MILTGITHIYLETLDLNESTNQKTRRLSNINLPINLKLMVLLDSILTLLFINISGIEKLQEYWEEKRRDSPSTSMGTRRLNTSDKE